MRRVGAGLLVFAALMGGSGWADTVHHRVERSDVDLAGQLPADLLRPEGRTRWDLSGLSVTRTWIVTLEGVPGSGEMRRTDQLVDKRAVPPRETRLRALTPGTDVERWELPHRWEGLLDVDGTAPIVLERRVDGVTDKLWIQTRRVGMGWVKLPSGPREVILQRALVHRLSPTGGYRPEALIHRFVDPRGGIVAEVWGPVSPDGRERLSVEGATVVDKVLLGGAPMKFYVDRFDVDVLTRLAWGYDRGVDTQIAALSPAAHVDSGDLTSATSWDFSGNVAANSLGEVVSTITEVNSDETCFFDECGFDGGGAGNTVKQAHEDRTVFGQSGLAVTNSAQQRENRSGDVTIWLRGVERTGGLNDTDVRLCYTGGGLTEVPLYQFQHNDNDGNGYYLQAGDTWTSGVMDGELNTFVENCDTTTCGFACQIYTVPCGIHPGTVRTEVVSEGPVTLPSGHTFNTVAVQSNTDICNGPFQGGALAADVRTVVSLWLAPWIGSVTRVQSKQVADSLDDWNLGTFDVVQETDFKFGLFPPLAINVDGVGEATVDLSWNPGSITDKITGYRVYWDTDSGADSDYANSTDIIGAGNTSTTIGGLDATTEYFFTVTSLSEYQHLSDPPGTPTPYESLRYPITVDGLPAEVNATTMGSVCIPTAEVTGLVVNPATRTSVEICWDPVSDPCLTGYQVLTASSPESDANFSALADTGLVTCETVPTSDGFFLVVAKGTGGSGPWGHFGR